MGHTSRFLTIISILCILATCLDALNCFVCKESKDDPSINSKLPCFEPVHGKTGGIDTIPSYPKCGIVRYMLNGKWYIERGSLDQEEIDQTKEDGKWFPYLNSTRKIGEVLTCVDKDFCNDQKVADGEPTTPLILLTTEESENGAIGEIAYSLTLFFGMLSLIGVVFERL